LIIYEYSEIEFRYSRVSFRLASRLIPVDADLHMKKNMKEHSTNYYDNRGLVLRRGQPFTFTVTFNQKFDANKHQLLVVLKTGQQMNSQELRVPVNGFSNGWSVQRLPIEDDKRNNRVCLQISSPSDAIIGKYTVS
jgi:hypothetical protein